MRRSGSRWMASFISVGVLVLAATVLLILGLAMLFDDLVVASLLAGMATFMLYLSLHGIVLRAPGGLQIGPKVLRPDVILGPARVEIARNHLWWGMPVYEFVIVPGVDPRRPIPRAELENCSNAVTLPLTMYSFLSRESQRNRTAWILDEWLNGRAPEPASRA